MKEQELTNGSTAFVFDDIPDFYTCVFLLEKKNRLFVLDTFAGSDSMTSILAKISGLDTAKEVIVVNSHFHWDHVWGNISFTDRTIVGHNFCREDLKTKWEEQIRSRGQYATGRIELVLPSLTFDSKLNYPDDGIEIFHSPGHTRDSISIFDHETSALYVFDNRGKPIIYVEDPNIDLYISTLEHYLELKPKRIFASHTIELCEVDIENTIRYLRNLENDGIDHVFSSDYEKKIHKENLKTVRGA